MSTRIAWWVPSVAWAEGPAPDTRPLMVIHTTTWPGVKACLQRPDGDHFTADADDVFSTEEEATSALVGRMGRRATELEEQAAAYRAAIEELSHEQG